ncbi:MAG: copper resistance system multicopper oxidase [Proteobacteria bacterium]|nr:copper resistance system multicopper oxidase [Pseudomonadota bacterium]
MSRTFDRRQILRGAALTGGGLALSARLPTWAQPVSGGIVKPLPTLNGAQIELAIDGFPLLVDGRRTPAIGVNGTVPAPLIRLKEGQNVRLAVANRLGESSSIHWHGLLVPFAMDGVPGISFPGINPHSIFVYEFPVIQSGTYWYHSHSGAQEQEGLYGPIVIDPAGPDPIAYDREHVIVLADHSPMRGEAIFRKLKQQADYFNYQEQTLTGLLADRDQTLKERVRWGWMRMDPTDNSDVTGSTYTYVINGYGPRDNWTALFTPGERVRLRFVNAAAQTNFNVRIPGLPMTIVQSDGQNVRPVETDEFQIAVAETYDVIVTPGAQAYTLVSEALDRSGLGRATLAPKAGMSAPVPPLRRRPVVTMKDMGMGDMAGMSNMKPSASRGIDPTAEQNASRKLAQETGWTGAAMGTTQSAGGSTAGMPGVPGVPGDSDAMSGMDHSQMPGEAAGMGKGGMSGMDMSMRDPKNAPQIKMGPGVQTIAPMPMDRTGERPQGLEDVAHRVLTYRDLVAFAPNPDVRAPSRSLDIHLTGNMERYMWSFDGQKLSDPADPIPFRNGERVRVNLINDTMMPHPIHLHGHFFELVTGHGDHAPRKHTVNVAPGGKVTFDVTADAPGDWAFHCHNLFHMTAGMMRVVTVRPFEVAPA